MSRSRVNFLTLSSDHRNDDAREIAMTVGWPHEKMGLFGACASLLDIGAPWRQLDSFLPVAKRRYAVSGHRIQNAIEQDAIRRALVFHSDD